jgi:hypothetical protein
MTDVVFQYSNPSPTGEDVPAAGWIECSLAVLEPTAESVRSIERFAVDIVAGLAIAACSPTPLGQAWKFTVHGVAGVGDLCKSVPVSSAPVRVTDLPDIDPDTLIVTPTNQAAWQGVLDLIEAGGGGEGGGGGGAGLTVSPTDPRLYVLTGAGAPTIPPTNTAPVITLQPVSHSSTQGDASFTLTAAATGTPTPTVVWDKSLDYGATWTATSRTTPSITVDVNFQNTRYRARFTNSVGTTTTEVVGIDFMSD